MKKIFNFIITFIILAIAGKYFPQSVYVNGFEGILFSTILIFIAEIILSWILFLFFIPIIFGKFEQYLSIIFIFIISFLWNPIILYLVSRFYLGFEIMGGFGTYLIISIILSFFTISEKK